MKAKQTSSNTVPETEIRSLKAGEESLFLGLVAAWPFLDDRRGDVFFARPMEHDKRFSMADVFGAFENGELVSCCQLFPRTLRLAGELVPVGGIGTVFTRTDARGRGLAPKVIEVALAESSARGHQLALLTANRFDWYEAMGFARWGSSKVQLRLRPHLQQPKLLGPSLLIEQFQPNVHLQQVAELASTYSADRHGTLVRDPADWDVSLALAGNPVEEFVVVQDPQLEQVVAFLRGCVMGGGWQILEWACAPGYEEHLAELIATTARTVGQNNILGPRLADPELQHRLRRRGFDEASLASGAPEWMMLCLDPHGLGARFGLAQLNYSEPNDVVNILMPPAAFHFWTSDRF